MNDEDQEDYDYEPPEPLNTAFVIMLALGAPLVHIFCFLILHGMGLRGVPVAGMAAIITYGMLFSLCAPRLPQPPATYLGFLPAPRAAWLAIPFLLWSLLISSEVDNMVQAVFPRVPIPDNPDPPMMGLQLILLLMVVYPIAYELFFRGVMQPIAVTELGPRAGILLTAALSSFAFSMGGGAPGAILPGIVNALVLGLLRHGSGSIRPGILLHSLAGGIQVMAYYKMLGIPGFDRTEAAHTPLYWLIVAAMFTGVGLRLCRHAYETRPPEVEEELGGGD